MKKYRYNCLFSNYSPFSTDGFEERLQEFGFYESLLWKSNLLITSNIKAALKASLLFPLKQIIVWTNEPRYDDYNKFIYRSLNFKNIKVFNVYTGQVFWHNNHFLSSYHYNDKIDLGLTKGETIPLDIIGSEIAFDKKKVGIGLFTRKKDNNDFWVKEKNIDLNAYRQKVALAGYQLGICDIAGKNWEIEVLEDTGFTGQDEGIPWWTQKINRLKEYRFNIAIENTNFPYYVTEKIWQPIKAGCLPIYWGKDNTIYQTFPRDSFIDAADFESVEDLWSTISSMTYTEWSDRLTKCIDVYNREIRKMMETKHSHFDEVVERIINNL